MKSVLALALVACLAVHVSAECANMCSGHGVCGTNDMCKCYRNWRGADCSERTCQFARSFVDTAQGDLNHDGVVTFASRDVDNNLVWAYNDGNSATVGGGSSATAEPTASTADTTNNFNTVGFVSVRTQWSASTFELFPASTKYRALNHVYMECSNKGVCDRLLGECVCYEGYEGSACQRSVCPNKCSGHGVCRNVKDITQDASMTGITSNYTYQLWDATKMQACVCDPGYNGVDCSQRMCPKGDDPLSPAAQDQVDAVVTVEFDHDEVPITGAEFAGSFKLKFTDAFGEEWVTTSLSGMQPHHSTTTGRHHDEVAAMLTGLPNDVIPSITVTSSAPDADYGVQFQITFTGNPGDMEGKLKVMPSSDFTDSAGNAVDIDLGVDSVGTKTNTECSDRGLCDYLTGICSCFRGYRLADCSGQSALAF